MITSLRGGDHKSNWARDRAETTPADSIRRREVLQQLGAPEQ